MQCILGAVEDHSLLPSNLGQQVIHHLNKEERLVYGLEQRLRGRGFFPHIIVRPQLQTAGADAEDTGKELILLKKLWDVEVLRQFWELFSQVSRFL